MSPACCPVNTACADPIGPRNDKPNGSLTHGDIGFFNIPAGPTVAAAAAAAADVTAVMTRTLTILSLANGEVTFLDPTAAPSTTGTYKSTVWHVTVFSALPVATTTRPSSSSSPSPSSTSRWSNVGVIVTPISVPAASAGPSPPSASSSSSSSSSWKHAGVIVTPVVSLPAPSTKADSAPAPSSSTSEFNYAVMHKSTTVTLSFATSGFNYAPTYAVVVSAGSRQAMPLSVTTMVVMALTSSLLMMGSAVGVWYVLSAARNNK